MSRATYFILWAHRGSSDSHSQLTKNPGEILDKKADEWTGRVEIRKEEISDGRRSMHGDIWICSRLRRDNL